MAGVGTMTSPTGSTLDRPEATAVPGRPESGSWRTVGISAVLAAVALNLVNAAVYRGEWHWWANFILVPGAALVLLAIGFGQRHPAARFTVAWIGANVLATGLLLLFGTMPDGWPVMIIVPCLGPAALLAVRLRDPAAAAGLRTFAMLGLLGVAVGATFLADTLGVIDLAGHRWWITYMFAAGAVPALNGVGLLLVRKGGYWFSVSVLLLALGGFTVLSAFRELNHWAM
jgi:hypothetical protein